MDFIDDIWFNLGYASTLMEGRLRNPVFNLQIIYGWARTSKKCGLIRDRECYLWFTSLMWQWSYHCSYDSAISNFMHDPRSAVYSCLPVWSSGSIAKPHNIINEILAHLLSSLLVSPKLDEYFPKPYTVIAIDDAVMTKLMIIKENEEVRVYQDRYGNMF